MSSNNDAMDVAGNVILQQNVRDCDNITDESYTTNFLTDNVTSEVVVPMVEIGHPDISNVQMDMDVVTEEVATTMDTSATAAVEESVEIADTMECNDLNAIPQVIVPAVDNQFTYVATNDNFGVEEEVIGNSTVSESSNDVLQEAMSQIVASTTDDVSEPIFVPKDITPNNPASKNIKVDVISNEKSKIVPNIPATFNSTQGTSILNQVLQSPSSQNGPIRGYVMSQSSANAVGSKILFKNNQNQTLKLIMGKNFPQMSSKSPIRLIQKTDSGSGKTYVITGDSSIVSNAISSQNFASGNALSALSNDHVVMVRNTNELSATSPKQPNILQKPKKKKEEEEIPDFLSEELKQGFKILRDLISDKMKSVNWPFVEAVNSNWPEVADYKDIIKTPMWLRKIYSNFMEKKYEDIKEPIADLRLMIENCYRYNGPDHPISKKALKIETMLEQKLALLSKEIREKTRLEATPEELEEDGNGQKRKPYRTLADGGTSIILNRVKIEKALKEKEMRKKRLEELKAEKEAAYQKAVEWENTLLNQDFIQEMKAMWELPQIGHFLYLTQAALNIPEISQFELERMLLMPRQSNCLHLIMTSLLANPNARANLDKRQPMKYRIWQEKLKLRTIKWYKLLKTRGNQPMAVFDVFGVEPAFFSVLGMMNPMEQKKFHELNFHQRIWLLKALCDYCLHTHKTIQEIIAEQTLFDQKEVVLGTDINGYIYVHFPQFCGQDLRIYRQVSWMPSSLNITPSSMKNYNQLSATRIERRPPEQPPKKTPPKITPPPVTPVRKSLRAAAKLAKSDASADESINLDVEGDPPVESTEDRDFNPGETVVPEVKVDVTVDEADEKSSTNLSKAIVDFDLEKELAISIRGRCSRKSERISEQKRARKIKRDDDFEYTDSKEDDDKSDADESDYSADIKEEVEDDAGSSIGNEEEISNDSIVIEEKDSDAEIEAETDDDANNEVDYQLELNNYMSGLTYEQPNLKKFELIVDGLESLKELVDKLIKEEDLPMKETRLKNKVPIMTRSQRNELALKNRLLNLLHELEPWKEKLSSAVKKTLQRMKKEWDDYDPKEAEQQLTQQEVWESDSDSEITLDKKEISSDDEDLKGENGDELQRIKTRYLKAMKKKEKKKAMKLEESEQFVVSSRGRVRKIRMQKKNDIYDYGDNEEEGDDSKDNDKSDSFTPEGPKRRKKDPESESADPTFEEKPKKGEATSKQSAKGMFTLEDGVLKVKDGEVKKAVRRTSTPKKPKASETQAAIMKVGDKQLLKIGNKTIVIPELAEGSTKTLSIDGKTILLQGGPNQQTRANVISTPNVKTGQSKGQDLQIVQLFNSSGHVQKLVTLAHAQKLLSATRKSPISSEKNIISEADGTILVPVIDEQGKVSYLKMKKNDQSKKAPEPVARNISPTAPSQNPPSNSQSSTILKSIIQQPIGQQKIASIPTVAGSPQTVVVKQSPLAEAISASSPKDLVKVVHANGKSIIVPRSSISSFASTKNRVVTVQKPRSKSPLLQSSIQQQLKVGQLKNTANKLRNVSQNKPAAASVTDQELTNAVSSLQDQTFVESSQRPPDVVAPVPNDASVAPKPAESPANKVVKVVVSSGGKMIPMTLTGEQLAGLSKGGSFVLNVNSRKLVPVSSSNAAQNSADSKTTEAVTAAAATTTSSSS